ncbi:UbiA-like polyprenyltransferase [Chlamydia vaughanii]|uniref:UbiA-like polyprenyltransferase n=1 Tax=Chlamydia vaughanii TaxID=3112552 RepID=UPI0032B1D495
MTIVKNIKKLLSIKYSLFSIFLLSATTAFSLSFPEISSSLSWEKGVMIFSLGGLAFILARTMGIVVNQVVDRSIDGRNPRTAARILPTQQISVVFCRSVVTLSGLVFLALSFIFNTNCGFLAVLAAILMTIYPHTKCFTTLCHWVLGAVYYLAILMNFYAFSSGTLSWRVFIVASLWGVSAGMIIAGNDIIYAIQDIAFDRKERLYSIPACFGEKKAIRIASACLIISLLSFLSIGLFITVAPWVGVLAILPVIVVANTIKSYGKIDGSNSSWEKCFFRGNIYLALSFFCVMVALLISKM